ncbi:hypothetical protein D3C85_1384020 [compost metagenome]
MKQVDFDALHIHLSDSFSSVEHHVMGFPWQAINNVCADANIMFAQLGNSVQVTLGVMRAINECGRGFVHGLQTHLYP